jgi:hypothetical protein
MQTDFPEAGIEERGEEVKRIWKRFPSLMLLILALHATYEMTWADIFGRPSQGEWLRDMMIFVFLKSLFDLVRGDGDGR